MIRLITASVLSITLAMADEIPLVTHTEFSYSNTTGNTNTSSLAFEGSVKKGWDMNIIRLHADAYKSQDDGTDSKNKWSTDLNYDYQFDPTVSFNYLIGYKKDHFSGFDYQLYTGPGMGMKVLNSDAHKLDFQANMLYSQDKPENEPLDTYVSTKFGGIYQWKIQDNVKFIQEATYRVDLEKMNNYFVYAKTAFETKINSSLSMGVSYKIDYVNMPPPPAGNNDRTFLVSLIIDY